MWPTILACTSAGASPTEDGSLEAGAFVLTGATLVDHSGARRADLHMLDGKIVGSATESETVLHLEGKFVVPAAIDSHVHLAYWPVAEDLAAHGVVGAVDLASPLGWLKARPDHPRSLAAGPMITAEGGYPTESWGRNGYGLEVGSKEEAIRAVGTAVDAGAGLIKVALTDAPTLSDDELRAVVDEAHRRGLVVVAHALDDHSARRAADCGVDVLAHTPIEALSPETVAAWRSRVVISTLNAFGGSPIAVDNLRRLRSAGATVLYGTDLGNDRVAGIDPAELRLLGQAGLDGAAILEAMTYAPAAIWKWSDLGRLDAGAKAAFLVLDTDPHIDPGALARGSPATASLR